MSIERDVFPQMAKEGVMYALATDDYWIDAGHPDTYIRANLEWVSRGKAPSSESIHDKAVVANSAQIRNCVIGAGAHVGENAVVESSVLLSGAFVADRANVVDSAVMGVVEKGGRAVRCVIGLDGIVTAGTTLIDKRVPAPIDK